MYLNYLEHARHAFLKSVGLDFAAITAEGIHLVVVRTEIDYRRSLKSGDTFDVTVSPERISRVRFGFRQNVVRHADGQVCVQALVIATALNPQGRPFVPDFIGKILPSED